MKERLRINTLSILSIIFLILGCSPENDALSTPEPSQVPPGIFATMSGGAYPGGFQAGDVIGIFPVRYENGQPGKPGNTNDPVNIGFTYDGVRWRAEAGREFYLNETPVDIYAYSPYDKDMVVASGSDLSAYPFDLSGDQNLKDADFLWAKTEQVSSGNNTVSLAFHHLMSRMEINLHYETPEEHPEVSIYNVQTAAVVDLSRGVAWSREDRKETVKPRLLSGQSGEVLFAYEAILVPQSLTAGTPFLTVDYDGEKLLFALPEDIEFEAGRNYIFNLTPGGAKERKGISLINDYVIR